MHKLPICVLIGMHSGDMMTSGGLMTSGGMMTSGLISIDIEGYY